MGERSCLNRLMPVNPRAAQTPNHRLSRAQSESRRQPRAELLGIPRGSLLYSSLWGRPETPLIVDSLAHPWPTPLGATEAGTPGAGLAGITSSGRASTSGRSFPRGAASCPLLLSLQAGEVFTNRPLEAQGPRRPKARQGSDGPRRVRSWTASSSALRWPTTRSQDPLH